jgi:hypothetical protein
MIQWINNIQIAFYHATFHRNLRKAEQAAEEKNIVAFKKYIYQAEDAWKKIVLLKSKI